MRLTDIEFVSLKKVMVRRRLEDDTWVKIELTRRNLLS